MTFWSCLAAGPLGIPSRLEQGLCPTWSWAWPGCPARPNPGTGWARASRLLTGRPNDGQIFKIKEHASTKERVFETVAANTGKATRRNSLIWQISCSISCPVPCSVPCLMKPSQKSGRSRCFAFRAMLCFQNSRTTSGTKCGESRSISTLFTTYRKYA